MFKRRNFVLHCSVLMNIAVLLYMCSHLMIRSDNISMGPSFVIQEEYAVKSPPQPLVRSNSDASALSEKSAQIKQQEQQPKYVDPESPIDAIDSNQANEIKDNANYIDGDIERTNQKQKLQQKEQQVADTNGEDMRFIVPTEQPQLTAAQNSQSNKLNADNNYNLETNFVNSSDAQANAEEHEIETRLRLLYPCHDKDFEPQTLQRGDYWVLKNYIRADHGELRCFQSVTYTTHADYTFLDNMIPLLKRWNAPISLALHAPGSDFLFTIKSIKYLRDCLPDSALVRQFATFHLYFSTKHVPKTVPKYNKILDLPIDCSASPPYLDVNPNNMYKTQKKLFYPVNVGRNIARDAAMTHFILACDIELYPNPGIARKFLEMIARNDAALQRKSPRVFVLPVFEVDGSIQVPRDKTELQDNLKTGKAIPFHQRVCSLCHSIPKAKEWVAANETDALAIFHIGKRTGSFVHWEPIYIGTNADPYYDERLSWEGRSDKMTQGYKLCVMDYEFHILDNGFLVHKPGIKILKKDSKRDMLVAKTNQLIRKIIYPELKAMYGSRNGCGI